MSRQILQDGTDSFDVTLVRPSTPTRAVLFAVGGGGDPERHLPLLTALAEQGAVVVAPHFERLVSPTPSEDHLLLRARRLRLALDAIAREDLVVAGVGHSIGATMLLALAGGRPWTRAGRPLDIAPDERLARIVLFTPAMGFFAGEGSLDAVHVPIQAWGGSEDRLTPPSGLTLLERASMAPDVRVVDGAGHFSFMHAPPPHVPEPLADREAFLATLEVEVIRFVLHGPT